MNLLQSLAVRTLGTEGAIEPPRVPYVSVFPDAAAEPLDPTTDEEVLPHAVGPAAPSPAERREPARPVPPPAAGDRPAIPLPASPSVARADRGDRGPEPISPAYPPVQRPIERRVEVPPRIVSQPRTPAPPPEVVTEIGPAEAVTTRDVHHTHHHHWVERLIEPPPAVVEPVVRPERAARADTQQRAPRAPAPPPLPVQAETRAIATPALPATGEWDAGPAPPVVPHVIHVTVDRVTVRMQQPAAPARSETTRPTAPAIGLDAYTAALRHRSR